LTFSDLIGLKMIVLTFNGRYTEFNSDKWADSWLIFFLMFWASPHKNTKKTLSQNQTIYNHTKNDKQKRYESAKELNTPTHQVTESNSFLRGFIPILFSFYTRILT